jgi:hypothetical protein
MALKLKNKISIVFLTLAILALSLSGCNPTVELIPTSTTPLTTPEPTQTSPPTSTTSPPSVVFVPPDDDFLSLAEPISSTLEQLAAQSGWTFVVANPFSPDIINMQIDVIVFVEPTDEILELIDTRSDTQFIAIGVEGLAPQANLSLIGPDGFRLDQQAFLGGYIAALMTQDWRVGEILGVSEQELSTIELGFRNGMKFYCGLCLLSYPPFHNYPVFSTLDSDWRVSIEFLQSYAVNTIFLFVHEYDLDAMDSLYESGIFLLGITSPPKDIQA